MKLFVGETEITACGGFILRAECLQIHRWTSFSTYVCMDVSVSLKGYIIQLQCGGK